MDVPAHQPLEIEGAEDGVYTFSTVGYHVVALLAKNVHPLCPVGTAAMLVGTEQLIVDETLCCL